LSLCQHGLASARRMCLALQACRCAFVFRCRLRTPCYGHQCASLLDVFGVGRMWEGKSQPVSYVKFMPIKKRVQGFLCMLFCFVKHVSLVLVRKELAFGRSSNLQSVLSEIFCERGQQSPARHGLG
jgi:hypothetical protein